MAQSAGVAKMRETWRWYGPADPVSLSDVRQAGAAGVVTALHEVPIGDVWPRDAILQRKALIEAAGLRWDVVESVPVHESIKQGTRGRKAYLTNYAQTLRNLGACGIHVVVYNFMPVIDWTRTDLRHEWHDGSHALSFDRDDFAAFDLHLLRRPGAEADYDEETRARAKARFGAMPPSRRAELERTVTAGLPGRMVEAYTLAEFQTALDAYASVPEAKFRDNLVHFLKAVVPAAECAATRATASARPPITACATAAVGAAGPPACTSHYIPTTRRSPSSAYHVLWPPRPTSSTSSTPSRHRIMASHSASARTGRPRTMTCR